MFVTKLVHSTPLVHNIAQYFVYVVVCSPLSTLVVIWCSKEWHLMAYDIRH